MHAAVHGEFSHLPGSSAQTILHANKLSAGYPPRYQVIYIQQAFASVQDAADLRPGPRARQRLCIEMQALLRAGSGTPAYRTGKDAVSV